MTCIYAFTKMSQKQISEVRERKQIVGTKSDILLILSDIIYLVGVY